MTTPKYSKVYVTLSGEDGNAFAIVGSVSKAIRREAGEEAAHAYRAEAMACKSYDALIQHAMKTVNVV